MLGFTGFFPTNECAVGEIGEASAVTHRTVVDCSACIVGKVEGTVGGACSRKYLWRASTVSSVFLQLLLSEPGGCS